MGIDRVAMSSPRWRTLEAVGTLITAAMGLASMVAYFEEWPLHRAMHVTVDAMMNNGSGKYAVQHAASRLVLSVTSLLGFFYFITWVVEMVMMSVTYYLDGADALDEDGRKVGTKGERISRAILYSVSTGCSGGFGHLSSDWLGIAHIAISVPTTAWLAQELSWYKMDLSDGNKPFPLSSSWPKESKSNPLVK